MLFPFVLKVGAISVEISQQGSQSPQAELDYLQASWEQLKLKLDKILEQEKYSNLSGKTKLGIEIIRSLSKRKLEEEEVINELIKTTKFSREEATIFLKRSVRDGIISWDTDGILMTNQYS
jgi:hypothetical protein